ncbi:zeta toxin family protein [Pseudomonas viridiflava]|uniref:zeta toxin family protein n=1 Tax=Pseudomonas viridiflava TaxID=33069 RepID=UPI00311A9735
MEFTDDEKRLWNETIKFARQNKKAIGRKLTSLDLYPAEDEPVSVFMSGSPGAGKTEASIALLNLFTSSSILRIDPDELRAEFDLYTGGNAYLFQGGISILISKIIDLALSQQQSFLLDGTLAKIDIARSNVERSLEKGRYVQVLYVYQNPLLAWEFVKAREQAEGRRILADHFVEQYFSARDVVNTLKLEYGKHVHVAFTRRVWTGLTTISPSAIPATSWQLRWKTSHLRSQSMKLPNPHAEKAKNPFAEFIRNAKSDEKKRIYSAVLTEATKRQNEIIAQVKNA